MLANPLMVHAQGGGQLAQAGGIALLAGEEGVVEFGQFRRDLGILHAAPDHGQDALVEAQGFRDFPGTMLRHHAVGGEDVDHRIGALDQVAEALLPGLTGGDVFLVDKGLEAAGLQAGDKVEGKFGVGARI